MFSRDPDCRQATQEWDQMETPRFETPTPQKKKRKVLKGKNKEVKPKMMKKFASMEPGFSNSQMLSHRIRFQRETEKAPVPAQDIPYPMRRRKQY